MPGKVRRVLETLWFFLKPYRLYLLILLGLCAANGLLETLHMALLHPILNASLGEEAVSSKGFFLSLLTEVAKVIPVDDVLISSCILFVIFTVLYSSSRLLYANLAPRVTAKIVREHEQKVFRKYTESDYRFFADTRQGELIYKGSQAPQFIGQVVMALTKSVMEVVLGVFVLFLLISISWKGTIAVVVAGAGYYYLTQYLSRTISYVTGRGMRRAVENENVIMNEYVSGAKQIRAGGSSSQWAKRFNQAATSRWKHWARNQFWNQVPARLLELLMFGAVGIVVIGIKVQYPDQFFSMIPMFGTFAFALFKLLPKLTSTGTTLMNVSNFLPNLETVREFLLDTTYTQMKNASIEFRDLQHGIDLDHVSFAYTGRESTLEDVSLSIEKDSVTAVVGPSGSGKSTLADLLLRLYDYDTGEIRIDG
ncbi:MAG: ATP-binding cassette domain-containing protein, partial [Dehalococcoidia bacterium]